MFHFWRLVEICRIFNTRFNLSGIPNYSISRPGDEHTSPEVPEFVDALNFDEVSTDRGWASKLNDSVP